MSRVVLTRSPHAAERGREFGAARAAQIEAALAAYLEHFEAGGLAGAAELAAWGEEALSAAASFSPSLAEEIEGIAAGAGIEVAEVAALNARTEILARVARRRRRGECSVLVAVGDGDPVAAQTWDWHEELSGAWLVWGFADAASGLGVRTLTEAGILAKLGVNSAGVGVLLNILHHELDGEGPIGVPIHLLLRRVLAESRTIFDAVRLIGSARLSASSAVTVIAAEGGEDSALTAELRPRARPAYLLPDPAGLLVHTNHFLSAAAVEGDLEPVLGPDSLFRLDVLRRRAAAMAGRDAADLVGALGSHLGAGGAICCHPEPGAGLGDRYATLATVVLEPAAARMRVSPGGPCEATVDGWEEHLATDFDPTDPTRPEEAPDVRAN